jgi:tRNA threonylcarbamoyladenosine biosynthesis protein TsaE
MIIEVHRETAMRDFGALLGAKLRGGEIIELIGDVGAGKTTLTKGIAAGMGVDEDVQSPSFTISRLYDTNHDKLLAHYDFYRLHDAGIMSEELRETLHDSRTTTVIEWAGIVEGVLPQDRLTISITSPTESSRRVEVAAGGLNSGAILKGLE